MAVVVSRSPGLSMRRYTTFDNLILYCVVLSFIALVGRQALASPIRAYLPAIWYLPDIAMIAAFFLIIFISFKKGNASILFFILLVICWAVYSFTELKPLSVVYGSRFVITFIIAFFVGFYCQKFERTVQLVFTGLAFLTIVGVFYDQLLGVPWADMSFEGAMGTEAISRQWWVDDQTRRVAGFGIASTDTALTIACVMLVISNSSSSLSRKLSLLLALPAMYAIWLTQQRATTVWFAFLWSLSFVFPIMFGRKGRDVSVRILQTIVFVAMAAVMLAPFLLYKVDLGAMVGAKAESLYDRTFNVWPGAIDHLFEDANFVIGTGLGAVGDPGLLTQDRIFLADNMFLNIALSLGIILAVLIWLRMSIMVMRFDKTTHFAASILALFAFLLLNGITAGIVVGVTGLSMLGYSIGLMLNNKVT